MTTSCLFLLNICSNHFLNTYIMYNVKFRSKSKKKNFLHATWFYKYNLQPVVWIRALFIFCLSFSIFSLLIISSISEAFGYYYFFLVSLKILTCLFNNRIHNMTETAKKALLLHNFCA